MASSEEAPHESQYQRRGLLLTHDWEDLFTPSDPVKQKRTFKNIEESDYQTETFCISNSIQLQAFLCKKVVFTIRDFPACPYQLLPQDSLDQDVCSGRSMKAVIRCKYRLINVEVNGCETKLSDDAIHALRVIEKASFTKLEFPQLLQKEIIKFLTRYGSHFWQGQLYFARNFKWMVVSDKDCDINHLKEIADEIFQLCEKYEFHFKGSYSGLWYNVAKLFDTTLWREDKKDLLHSIKVCISHDSHKRDMSYSQWRQHADDFITTPVFSPDSVQNIVPVWKIIKQDKYNFQNATHLSSLVQSVWEILLKRSKHAEARLPEKTNQLEIPSLGDPWKALVEAFGLNEYFPRKLSFQKAISLRQKQTSPLTRQDLPWEILSQIVLMNCHCREVVLKEYDKQIKQNQPQGTFNRKRKKSEYKGSLESCPHPMDMILLLFFCSDFKLRQILARKLFMCRLAIPFIVRTEKSKHQVLLWPLQSIVMEWREDKAMEEPLVSCKLNTVTFVRFGKSDVSKSKLLNNVLSENVEVFFHREMSLGKTKRTISNGIVEVSHFLPSGDQEDVFSKPALFFNLRGDACELSVQYQQMCDISSVLVVLIDISTLTKELVQEKLCNLNNKISTVIILSNSDGSTEQVIEQQEMLLEEALGDKMKRVKIVETYEDEGSSRIIKEVIAEIQQCINDKMLDKPEHSLETLATSNKMAGCEVDEDANEHCKKGKRCVENVLKLIMNVPNDKRKRQLLIDGKSLRLRGKLMRDEFRVTENHANAKLQKQEKIKKERDDLRKKQCREMNDITLMTEMCQILELNGETRMFALFWIQQALDAVSRETLPCLRSDKKKKWNLLQKMKNKKGRENIAALEKEVSESEELIAEVSFGLEHIMRAVGQVYELAEELKELQPDHPISPSYLPRAVASLLLDGHPMEIMNGDHGIISTAWIDAVLRSLSELVGSGKKIFVLSVLGIQSSGKSTLLNTMFGLEFAVSAGRCTRGIYAQVIPVDASHLPFDYLLILDSEGLRAQELGDQNLEHDNELATLVIGLADLSIINLKGENVTEMSDVLQIVVHAFLRMVSSHASYKRQCMFYYQNVPAVNASEKLAEGQQKLQELLDRMTWEAAQSQGLAQVYPTFNKIIAFRGEEHVSYFSDLWHGDPPMATVNPGYSKKAKEAREKILSEIIVGDNILLTIPQFIERLKNMWKGILSDDFVFNFRNNLAVQAYIDLDGQVVQQKVHMENELLLWVKNAYDDQVLPCKSESQLLQYARALKNQLKSVAAQHMSSAKKILEDFFDNHPLKAILYQWKTEKLITFDLFGQTQVKEIEAWIDTKKSNQQFQLRKHTSLNEDEVIAHAIESAQNCRESKTTESQLFTDFDRFWQSYAHHLTSLDTSQAISVYEQFDTILYDYCHENHCAIYLHLQPDQLQKEATTALKLISVAPLDIKLKDAQKQKAYYKTKTHPEMDECRQSALIRVQEMLEEISELVENMCLKEGLFDQRDGKAVISTLHSRLKEHNDLTFKESRYTFLPAFMVTLFVCVASFAAKKFQKRNDQYEKIHGIKAQLEAIKDRVFTLFKNTVKQSEAELTAAEDFCAVLKSHVITFVKRKVEQSISEELPNVAGSKKYNAIVKILDEVVDEKSFKKLHEYVHYPKEYAQHWFLIEAKQIIFEKDLPSKYATLAAPALKQIMSRIRSNGKETTEVVVKFSSDDSLSSEDRYRQWIEEFCQNMRQITDENGKVEKVGFYVDPAQLRVAESCSVTNFDHYQKFFSSTLQKLESELDEIFSRMTYSEVEWTDGENPFLKFFNHLWGCPETCPFCSEPCQYSEPEHKESHQCIQHRPKGIRNIYKIGTKELVISNCSTDITNDRTFYCSASRYKCQSTDYCKGTKSEQKKHKFKEYKKFLPKWDITPDPNGDASKFWQWAMNHFKVDLLAENTGKTLDIPDSWTKVKEKDARESLRVYLGE